MTPFGDFTGKYMRVGQGVSVVHAAAPPSGDLVDVGVEGAP